MAIAEKSIYLDYLYLMNTLNGYSSPKSKLTTMIKSGEVIKIRRGLYLAGDNLSYSVKTLANMIYGPSYLSFEYALSFYNLIPEKVKVITSASYNKNKTRKYETPVGFFTYGCVNPSVYPYGIVRSEENGSPFLIATKEKAICDTLSKISGIRNVQSLAVLLENDLRIDHDELMKLEMRDVAFFAELYGKPIIRLFADYLVLKKL